MGQKLMYKKQNKQGNQSESWVRLMSQINQKKE